MGFILAPIALLLFSLIGFVHSFVTIVINVKRRAFFRNVSKIKSKFAFDVDVFGNYLFAETWNLLFCKKGYKVFGVFGETISSGLGKLLRDKKASWFGYAFAYFLNFIWFTDWFRGGHCKVSIMKNYKIKENKNSYFSV